MMKIKIKLSSRSSWQKKERSILFNNQVRHLLKWLIRTYGINPAVWEPACQYMWFLEHMCRHKGKQTVLLTIKDHRLRVTSALSKNFLLGKDLTYDGFPKRLKGFIPYLRSRSILEIRFIMTLLYSLRRITLPINPDLETVTSPSKANYYEWILKYIPRFSKALSRKLSRKFKHGNKLLIPFWNEFHLTTKGSPSGGQALVNCLQDLVCLPKSLIDSILILGGETLNKKMNDCLSHSSELSILMIQPCELLQPIRKISAIEDSEGKTRLIAIGDYWSQTCLKPIHDYLNHVLSKIPQDQTFNQGKGLSNLSFSSEKTYYSFDLTAFTDRFPSRILVGLLTYNCGLSRALAWYDVINGYDFLYKSPKGFTSNISYSVGNPMGFYTSWPLSTLCHHFIIFVSCQECGISWNTSNYKLLGDDIVIWDKVLAEKYQEIILSLGVDISYQKSHIGNSLFEFAKRIFIAEGEISPFSIKAGLKETKSYLSFFELIQTYRDKDWIPVTSSLKAAFDFYSTKPNHYKSSSIKKQFIKIKDSNYLHRRLCGYLNDLELVRMILMTFNYPRLTCNQMNIAKSMFINTIVQVFEESASSYSTDIHLRLERALMYFTSLEEDKSEVVYSHPYSFIVGKYVEETYLKTMKQAYDYDTLYSGEWVPYFRILKASDGTSILTDRNYIKPVSSSPLLIRKLREVAEQLATNPYF
jgi:hypothetical protein